MKKEILSVLVSLLAVVMLTTPMVSAVPWTYPKNNEKFKEFGVEASLSFLDILFGDHQYIPSFDKVNKLIITVEENMLNYEITVDGTTYYLGSDFTYTGVLTTILYDPVFNTPTKLWPEESSQMHATVDYMYEFLPASGIEGTIQMRYVTNNGASNINSLAGTGDLQNVQIKATAWNELDPSTWIMSIFHEGRVSGWPE